MAITTSVFELFKIGPGPSSSHTIGPMKAALRFREALQQLPDDTLGLDLKITVTLYGSLSATGRGHGTDRAVVAGLLGWEPEKVDPAKMNALLQKKDDCYFVPIRKHHCLIDHTSIIFGPLQHDFPFCNTLEFTLTGEHNAPIYSERYYSVGGGFIRWDGWEPEKPKNAIPYPYTTMAEFKAIARNHPEKSIIDILLANESAVTGKTKDAIYQGVYHIINTMAAAVERGLSTTGELPGPVKLKRKAPTLHHSAQNIQDDAQKESIICLNAYSLAASEENAAGNLVVTAPTSGASGVIPGVLHWLRTRCNINEKDLADGLIIAALIGFIIKENASISGAEVGCQGEVGSASAMAAGLIAYTKKCNLDVISSAAEIALEHHLGMTCDPVGGYVQIPCIERNAMGGVKAFNAYIMASTGDPASQVIDLDRVIKVMYETGKDMSHKYRETSLGGLALSLTEC